MCFNQKSISFDECLWMTLGQFRTSNIETLQNIFIEFDTTVKLKQLVKLVLEWQKGQKLVNMREMKFAFNEGRGNGPQFSYILMHDRIRGLEGVEP
ncbi:hypothetical protein B9Z55_027532 [Caenorhabditis nigoni]|uniref:Uncharacterized protein n=1 Tax=Caenorhabditis nigoni TaxID=1611254 RepID=A0A2G5SFJ9_9PELO|nr:hypothetical protein B9Z55_027532 [Caenorhabditis nigoni]